MCMTLSRLLLECTLVLEHGENNILLNCTHRQTSSIVLVELYLKVPGHLGADF